MAKKFDNIYQNRLIWVKNKFKWLKEFHFDNKKICFKWLIVNKNDNIHVFTFGPFKKFKSLKRKFLEEFQSY